jgi:hypothetical protein
MTNFHSNLNFYFDTLVVQALHENVLKTASSGIIASLTESIKTYVTNNIDPNNKTRDIINILGPGIILSAFGFSKIGLLFTLSMRVFNIDVYSAINSILSGLKSLLSNNQLVSSSQVDNIVSTSIQASSSDMTEAELQSSLTSYNQLIQDVRVVKLGMVYFASLKVSQAKPIISTLRRKNTSILVRVLSWIFKVALASAGLMVAGDVVNKLVGRPNALDGTKTNVSSVTSNQTVFKLNPLYKAKKYNAGIEWIENVSNTKSSISNMLISFAKEVYSGLDGLENIIQNTAGFQAVLDNILFFNRTISGYNMVFIPTAFTSKRQIVDMFIDDVAEKVAKSGA